MLTRASTVVASIFIIFPVLMYAQANYNPFVSDGNLVPSPLKPVESAGTGVISFNTGNSGTDPFLDLKLQLTIDLSNGVPDNSDPIAALGGSAAPYFSWKYSKGVYTGTQVLIIPGNFTGDITIAYQVTKNSPQSAPANGFTAQVIIGPYTSGNSTTDDAITYNTYTECPIVNPPGIGAITQPDCSSPLGSVNLTGLPTGTWTITTYPGEAKKTDSGSSTLINGLSPGKYNFTVTTAEGCTSAQSADVVIDTPPAGPAAPVIGTLTQPTCAVPTGTVNLSGLPSPGSWTLIRHPGGSSTGSGADATVPDLAPGTYYFTVTNSTGCVSGNSDNVIINAPPDAPPAPVVGTITQPTCQTATGSVILNGLPSGNWTVTTSPGNATTAGTGGSVTITGLARGTYTFRVTDSQGCTSASTGHVVIDPAPSLPDSPNVRIDCLLGAGSAVVTVSSPTGTGYQYRLDNGDFQSSARFSGVSNGNHTVTVMNPAGCSATGTEFTVACGCVNGPSVTLSSRTGTACGITPVTVTGNRFGGNATSITITTDGAGTVAPTTVSSSPFVFTYTPVAADIGKTINLTFTTNNPLGSPCVAAVAIYSLAVTAVPAAPVAGVITQPTCTISTGSVVLSGLPSSGTWNLTRTPGNVTTTGSGQTYTVQGLQSGTYTFSVSSLGCVSASSTPVQINPQPPVLAAPVAGPIVQPTCATATGNITVNGLPGTGTWTLTMYPGTIVTAGTGASTVISALPSGIYNFTVANNAGCTSASSANMVINPQPVTPLPPVTGTVTAPTCQLPSGSVVLTGLPSGAWSLASVPPGVLLSASGITTTVMGLAPGTYAFTVTNTAGCTSGPSANIIIPEIPNSPVLTITAPASLCSPATADITAAGVTAGSTPGLTYTYWVNAAATVAYPTPSAATSGTYYIKGTNESLCYVIKPVTVTIADPPVANAGADMDLEFNSSADVSALGIRPGETGHWSVFAGTGNFAHPESSSTTVTDLGTGENIFVWTVSNGICPPAADTLKIKIRDLVIPTLITPNNDGKNDYFILNGIESFTNNELLIFDRRGIQVFHDKNYMNNWDGVDQDNRPLRDDTYFFVLKTVDGRYRNGFIVIRR